MIYRKQTKPSAKHPLLLAFGGKERSGKTTSAEYIIHEHGGKKFAFADHLKASVYDLNAIRGRDLDAFLTYAKDNGFDFDFHSLPRANINNPRREDKIAWINRNKEEFREIMQVYGDFKRDQDPAYFIDKTMSAIQKAIEDGDYVIVIDDVRFRNEADALEDIGFSLVRVNATDEARKARGASNHGNHESEIQLDSYYHAHTVFNNAELHALHSQIENVIEQVINKEN